MSLNYSLPSERPAPILNFKDKWRIQISFDDSLNAFIYRIGLKKGDAMVRLNYFSCSNLFRLTPNLIGKEENYYLNCTINKKYEEVEKEIHEKIDSTLIQLEKLIKKEKLNKKNKDKDSGQLMDIVLKNLNKK